MRLRAIKFLIGLLLLPLCAAVTLTAGRILLILAQSPSRLPMLHVFACVSGVAIWAIIWLFMPPMMRTYVLGHELTHALWALLFGGKVSRLNVSEAGGSVQVSKSNTWITLAPYFFPLYTFAVALLWVLLAWLVPLSRPYSPVFLFWIGLTWAFHLTFTVRFLAIRQPDIREHGRLYSYTLIYLLNLLSIGSALLSVSSWNFYDAGVDVLQHLQTMGRAAWTFIVWAWTLLPPPRT